MSTHQLKTHPGPFQALVERKKRFEHRRDDREPPFAVGDWLHLREWIPTPTPHSHGRYTGRMVAARVSYLLRGPDFDLTRGYVVMSLDEMTYLTYYPFDPEA